MARITALELCITIIKSIDTTCRCGQKLLGKYASVYTTNGFADSADDVNARRLQQTLVPRIVDLAIKHDVDAEALWGSRPQGKMMDWQKDFKLGDDFHERLMGAYKRATHTCGSASEDPIVILD